MSYLTYFIRNVRSDSVGDFPLIVKMTAQCVMGFGSLQSSPPYKKLVLELSQGTIGYCTWDSLGFPSMHCKIRALAD